MRNSMRETPSHTDFPPHTVMLLELRTIQKKINNFRFDIKSIFITELDKRVIEGGLHHASNILEKIEKSHTRKLDRLERF